MHQAWQSLLHSASRSPKQRELKPNSRGSKTQSRGQCRPSCPCLLEIPGWHPTEQMWRNSRQDRHEDQEIPAAGGESSHQKCKLSRQTAISLRSTPRGRPVNYPRVFLFSHAMTLSLILKAHLWNI